MKPLELGIKTSKFDIKILQIGCENLRSMKITNTIKQVVI